MSMDIQTLLPILIPVIILEIILVIVALRVLLKHPDQVRGPKFLWILVILFIQIIGPIVFLTFGRDQG